ncbi:hypothetical protein HELRODRAFT_183986 [Helobdella robusta]|uniref:Uncharacterized protein n=1 Tax=Helobdella robusta TaxID=6412 RepID=T1FKE2_HELRO|nr:hypothetical protein HELRODRAFT_183986 [Helobdella robusta]ESO09667.1 hypothetical protein HELRODRAFT_183986 [Helobdella robusta]
MSSPTIGTCPQFTQHAWKQDFCANCSKPKAVHKMNDFIVEAEVCSSASNNNNNKFQLNSKEDAKSKFINNPIQKPDKPVKPCYLLHNSQQKNIKLENASKSIKKDTSHYYQVYDITAKGASGKPVDLNSTDDESHCDKNSDDNLVDSYCPMATPYTVVDVITSTLEKNRQLAKAKQNLPTNLPPSLPTTPAPDYKRKCMTIGRKDSKQILADVVDRNKLMDKPSVSVDGEQKMNRKNSTAVHVDENIKESNFFSPEHYKPRLYEEIDDEFLEKVATLQNQKLHDKEEEKDEASNGEIVDSLTAQNDLNASGVDRNKNVKKKQDAPKRSFFQKLLGRGNKEIDDNKTSKSEKVLKKNSSLNDVLADETNLNNCDIVSKKSLDLLTTSTLVDNQSLKCTSLAVCSNMKSSLYENSPEVDVVSRKSQISEDFVKEVEEKIETLVRKQSSNKMTVQSSSCEQLDCRASCDNLNNDADGLGDFDKLKTSSSKNMMGTSIVCQTNEPASNIRSSTIIGGGSSTLKLTSSRKSMTTAEAKLARKMLVAPPPPPLSTNPVLKSSETIGPVSSQSPTDDVFKSPALTNKTSLIDGFMADLDEILKRDGFGGGGTKTDNASNTLPNLLSKHSDKKSTTTHCSNVLCLTYQYIMQLQQQQLQHHLFCNRQLIALHLMEKYLSFNFPNLPPEQPSDHDDGDDVNDGNVKGLSWKASMLNSIKLEDSVENRFRELSRFTHRSLQNYLSTSMTTTGNHGNRHITIAIEEYKTMEMVIIKKLESKSEPTVKQGSALFYEMDVSDVEALQQHTNSIVIMVDGPQQTLTQSNSRNSQTFVVNHQLKNVEPLHSFHLTAPSRTTTTTVKTCWDHFTPSNPTDQSNITLHILPYSKIFQLSTVISCSKKEISTPITDKLCYMLPSSKHSLSAAAASSSSSSPWRWLAMTMLGLLDDLVENKDSKTSLRMEDVILALPLSMHPINNKLTDVVFSSHQIRMARDGVDSGKNAEIVKNRSVAEKQIIDDLIKLIKSLIELVASCKKPTTPPTVVCLDKKQQPFHKSQLSSSHTNTTSNNNNTDVDSSSTNIKNINSTGLSSSSSDMITAQALVELKCQRFMKKIERVIHTNDLKVWTDVMKLRNSLELCFWGPESDEDLKVAAIEPNRHEILGGWLSVSRGQVLTELMQFNDTQPKSFNDDFECLKLRCECVRRAEFLNNCNVDILLDAIKWIFF